MSAQRKPLTREDRARLKASRVDHPKHFDFCDVVTLYELERGVEPVEWPLMLERPAPDLSDVLACRVPERPFNLAIWEPIHTKAPSPARCQPYCCYIKTIIFYHRPYICVPGYPSRGLDGTVHRSDKVFAVYDQAETRLSWNDVIRFDGDRWTIGGGRVVWKHQRWWMRRMAKRVAEVVDVRGRWS